MADIYNDWMKNIKGKYLNPVGKDSKLPKAQNGMEFVHYPEYNGQADQEARLALNAQLLADEEAANAAGRTPIGAVAPAITIAEVPLAAPEQSEVVPYDVPGYPGRLVTINPDGSKYIRHRGGAGKYVYFDSEGNKQVIVGTPGFSDYEDMRAETEAALSELAKINEQGAVLAARKQELLTFLKQKHVIKS